jgi:hypothetical protein
MQMFKSMRVAFEPLLAIAVVLAAIAIFANLAMAVLASSTDIVGMANAIGACALVLADDAGAEPSAQCVAEVGDRYPTSVIGIGAANAHASYHTPASNYYQNNLTAGG